MTKRSQMAQTDRASTTGAWRQWACLTAILCVAAGFRIWHVGFEAMWFDEAWSVNLSSGSVPAVVEASAHDSTPPLYFLGLRLWRSFTPEGDGWMRGYSVLWSLVGIALLFGLVRSVIGWRAGIIAAALAAVNPFDIYLAQELRMYAQAAPLATAAAWALWIWLERRHGRTPGRWTIWALYVILVWCMLMTHYVCIAVVLAQGLIALTVLMKRRDWRGAAEYCAAGVTVAVLFAPWYGFLLRIQGGFNNANYAWMVLPPYYQWVDYLVREYYWGVTKQVHYFWPPQELWAAAMVALALGLAIRAARSPQMRPGIRFLAALLVLPILVVAILSVVHRPIYANNRFPLFVLPAFLALCGAGIDALPRQTYRLSAAAMIAATMIIGTLLQAHIRQKSNWREFAALWRAQPRPPACVVFYPAHEEVSAVHAVGEKLPSVRPEKFEGRVHEFAGKEMWAVDDLNRRGAEKTAQEKFHNWVITLGPVRDLPVSSPLLRVTAIRIAENSGSIPLNDIRPLQ